jgi:hypothetical protein
MITQSRGRKVDKGTVLVSSEIEVGEKRQDGIKQLLNVKLRY